MNQQEVVLNDLEVKRGNLLDDARAIYEPALEGGRSLEEDERGQLKNIDEEIAQIDEKLAKQRDDEALVQKMKGYEAQAQKGRTNGVQAEVKGSVGEQFVSSPVFKSWLKNIAPSGRIPSGMKGLTSPAVTVKGLEVKTLITGASDTSAGAFIVADDTGEYVPLGRHDLTVLNLVSRRQTQSDVVEFVRQTAQVSQAAPTAEATATADASGTKPEGEMAFERVSVNVQTIPVWTPATKQALADAGQLRGIIDDELRSDLRDELANQILNGDGVSPNFTGIYNTTNLLGQSYVTDLLTTTRKAITNVRSNGKVIPTAWLMHPNDWEAFDLLKNSSGDYYRGGPFAAGPQMLWRVPVVESFQAVEGSPLLGAWLWAALWDREETTISVSDSHSDFFVRNMVAILAELRAAFGVKKPSAFCQVSLSGS